MLFWCMLYIGTYKSIHQYRFCKMVHNLHIGDIVYIKINKKKICDLEVCNINNGIVTFKNKYSCKRYYYYLDKIKKFVFRPEKHRSLISYIIEVLKEENCPLEVKEIAEHVYCYGYTPLKKELHSIEELAIDVSERISHYLKTGGNEIVKFRYGVYKHKDCPAYYIAPLTKEQIKKAIFEENKKKNRKIKF